MKKTIKETTITNINEIVDKIAQNDGLHDWSVEYIFCDGKTAKIILKSYECEKFFRLNFNEIANYRMDIDMLMRYVYEVNIEFTNFISVDFEGVDISIESKELILEIYERKVL